jgi:thiamine-monophosphate kinase
MRGGNRGNVLRVGIGDDAAVLAVRRGEEIVVTTDFSLEDVHFRRAWHAPEAVGHKCLARGLSDIAAMGARPVAAFVSLAVPAEFTSKRANARSWVDRFYDGLLALAERWQVPLAGGDLAQSPGGAHARAAADIAVVGAVERGRALLRSGAQAGEVLYVTGMLGGAAAELRAVTQAPRKFRNVTVATSEHPHFFPEPRIHMGRTLVRRRLATAAIDISDGLSVDLQHLCEESGLRAEVDAALLPIGAGATLEDALHGGDDYELLFTADPGAHIPRSIAGVPVHRIGRMLRRQAGRPQMTLVEDGRRRELKPEGWQHF